MMGRLENLRGDPDCITTSGAEFIALTLRQAGIGGLQGIVAKLRARGLDRPVQSWLGDGDQLPVTPEQLRAVLGHEPVEQIARELGLPVDTTLKILAEQIPIAIRRASVGGRLPPD
jgi:uncharacterized protein YidB (DUF937 family)